MKKLGERIIHRLELELEVSSQEFSSSGQLASILKVRLESPSVRVKSVRSLELAEPTLRWRRNS